MAATLLLLAVVIPATAGTDHDDGATLSATRREAGNQFVRPSDLPPPALLRLLPGGRRPEALRHAWLAPQTTGDQPAPRHGWAVAMTTPGARPNTAPPPVRIRFCQLIL